MAKSIPSEGAASAGVQKLVAEEWLKRAKEANIDLTGFDPKAALGVRIAWAIAHGLIIGCILSRFSSKLQHSTTEQAMECTQFAAKHGIYIPPELVCVDEAKSGRKVRRDGLNRVKEVLEHTAAKVLLVYKVSRIFRKAYKGLQFFTEEVLERGKRAISISQGIDTDDATTWKPLAYMHGMCDELLLDSIADHVRSGLKSLFSQGYSTGPLTVGYEPAVVPGPTTKNGKPRTMPKVTEWVQRLIVQHFEWISQGMSIRQGWRRWVSAGGPKDPRSTSPHMTYSAYRRMLSNPRYLGIWAFGRKRSRWSNSKDYNMQVLMPDTEVTIVRSEELRIVSDELFNQVQAILAKKRGREPGPRRHDKVPELWDLVTDCFLCSACTEAEGEDVRMYQCGAKGNGMRCKRDVLCKCQAMIRRQPAVLAVCQELAAKIGDDKRLLLEVFSSAGELETADNPQLQNQLDQATRRLTVLQRKVSDLRELAGVGTDEDRAETMKAIKATQAERAQAQVDRDRLQVLIDAQHFTVTIEQVEEQLNDIQKLLTDGAAGRLGEDLVHRAVSVFRMLTGGRILVQVEQRSGRKTANVRGSFTPRLLEAVKTALGDPREHSPVPTDEVTVWLRQPPQVDRLAPIVHDLVDVQKLSFRDAEPILRSQGYKLNRGTVTTAYRRYYQMLGQSVPRLPYNNGHTRKSR